MSIIEFRAFNFETRGIDDEGKFDGYGSVFGSVALGYNTVMDKGCFLKSIKDNKGLFPLLWFHSPTTPVGSFIGEEDKKGLLTHGDVDLDIEPGRRMYSGMKKGYIDRMSIGFDRVNEIPVEKSKDGHVHITEAKLWEVSLITRNFAADEQALISDVRATSTGLQRVSKALKDGATLELQNALVDLRCLLGKMLLEPTMQSDSLCDTMKEIKALLIGEQPTIVTAVDEKPPLDGEPHLHSLLDELRAFATTLH